VKEMKFMKESKKLENPSNQQYNNSTKSSQPISDGNGDLEFPLNNALSYSMRPKRNCSPLEFHTNMPSQRIFSMWEQELIRFIQLSYPDIGFEETLALKRIICLMLDISACGLLE
jgi:hypothetical protein